MTNEALEKQPVHWRACVGVKVENGIVLSFSNSSTTLDFLNSIVGDTFRSRNYNATPHSLENKKQMLPATKLRV